MSASRGGRNRGSGVGGLTQPSGRPTGTVSTRSGNRGTGGGGGSTRGGGGGMTRGGGGGTGGGGGSTRGGGSGMTRGGGGGTGGGGGSTRGGGGGMTRGGGGGTGGGGGSTRGGGGGGGMTRGGGGGTRGGGGGMTRGGGGGGMTRGGGGHGSGGHGGHGGKGHGGKGRGGGYYGRHAGYRPSYSQIYLGPGGLGYSYYGRGFGISVGLPLNRFYNNDVYYGGYYDVAPTYVESYAQPYYVESYPTTVTTEPIYGVPAETLPPVEEEAPIPAPEMVLDDDSGSVIPAAGNAGEYQLQAETAFRENRFEDAARFATHAIIEDGENGKLHLFAAQIFFALGDYRASASAIHRAASLLDRSEWGFVIENYKEFYRGKDYVNQMDALVQFTRDNPQEGYVHFLRGYHYKYLGYDEAAQKPLARALELEPRDRLAAELLVMAGGQLPAEETPTKPVDPDAVDLNLPANDDGDDSNQESADAPDSNLETDAVNDNAQTIDAADEPVENSDSDPIN